MNLQAFFNSHFFQQAITDFVFNGLLLPNFFPFISQLGLNSGIIVSFVVLSVVIVVEGAVVAVVEVDVVLVVAVVVVVEVVVVAVAVDVTAIAVVDMDTAVSVVGVSISSKSLASIV